MDEKNVRVRKSTPRAEPEEPQAEQKQGTCVTATQIVRGGKVYTVLAGDKIGLLPGDVYNKAHFD